MPSVIKSVLNNILNSVMALFLVLNIATVNAVAAEKVAKPLSAEAAVDKKTPETKPANNTETLVKTVCAACHGVDGNSAMAINPKLAGQHPEYLLKQLTNFKEGKRANAVMAGMVANLSNDDMKELAQYFSGQKHTLAKAKSNGAGSLGEKIYRAGNVASGVPACSSCHGATGAGIPKQYPRLNGQHADYTTQQLRTFRTGERANAPMMMTIAAKMTDAEMQAVADYIQGLR